MIGDNVKKFRNKKGLTQDRLARKADIPYTTFTKSESNIVKKPSVQTVAKIAKALDVGMEELIRQTLGKCKIQQRFTAIRKKNRQDYEKFEETRGTWEMNKNKYGLFKILTVKRKYLLRRHKLKQRYG